MYLVKVEFNTRHDKSEPINAEFINDNCAIFETNSRIEVEMIIEESRNREDVKKILVYRYDSFLTNLERE